MPTALALLVRGRWVGDQALVGEVRLRVLVRLLGVRRDVLRVGVEERGQGGRGVLGVAVDLAGLQGLQGDRLVAQVEVRADVVARGLQALRVDLAEDVLLGEVLRPDGDLHAGVVGIRLDQPAPAVGGRLVVVAAGDDADGQECDGEQREQRSQPDLRAHRGFLSQLAGHPRPAGSRESYAPAPARCSARPRGVNSRCTPASASSTVSASSATRIAPASTPSSP